LESTSTRAPYPSGIPSPAIAQPLLHFEARRAEKPVPPCRIVPPADEGRSRGHCPPADATLGEILERAGRNDEPVHVVKRDS
jgi:hypothetical protein